MITEADVWERVADICARLKEFYPQFYRVPDPELPVLNRRSTADRSRMAKYGLSFGPEETAASRYAAWLRKHPRFMCAYCDESPTRRQRQVDHVIPLSKGGKHRLDNVVPSCRRCNYEKRDRLMDGEPKVAERLTVRAWSQG